MDYIAVIWPLDAGSGAAHCQKKRGIRVGQRTG